MPEGRRLAINVAMNGHLSPDGSIEKSVDGRDWWIDTTPWLPFETPDRCMLAIKTGSAQVFESHATREEAEESFRAWLPVDRAEIRPPFSRPIQLK